MTLAPRHACQLQARLLTGRAMRGRSALCAIVGLAVLADVWAPRAAAQTARTLVDELAALSWEKSMQMVKDADYTATLHRHISRAIDSGRGLDERDGDGRTALHWAAANGHQDQVAALLKAGADANSACRYVGQTPLYMATRWGRGKVVEELLRRGADPAKPDKFGKNAFDAADAAGDVSAQMRELLQRATLRTTLS